MQLSDNKSHLLTKFKESLKLGARDKLGNLLVEAKRGIDLKNVEFYAFMKDRSEWMVELQEFNWKKTIVEQEYVGEQPEFFAVINSDYGFVVIESNERVLTKEQLN